MLFYSTATLSYIDGPRCGVHLINEGVVVNGNSVTVMFERDGPSVNNIRPNDLCTLDGSSVESCKGHPHTH